MAPNFILHFKCVLLHRIASLCVIYLVGHCLKLHVHLHCTALHATASSHLHRLTLSGIVVHFDCSFFSCIDLLCFVLHCAVFRCMHCACITLNRFAFSPFIGFHCVELAVIALYLHRVVLHGVFAYELRCIAVHCFALTCFAFHCTALYCMALYSVQCNESQTSPTLDTRLGCCPHVAPKNPIHCCLHTQRTRNISNSLKPSKM